MPKTILYTGLTPPQRADILHCPLIQIVPRSIPEFSLTKHSHIIFTSKNAVRIFCDHTQDPKKTIIAIGRSTAASLQEYGIKTDLIPSEESSEGIVKLLKTQKLCNPSFFWPHSAQSQRTIPEYLHKKGWPLEECILYDTVPKKPAAPPDLTRIFHRLSEKAEQSVTSSSSSIPLALSNGQCPRYIENKSNATSYSSFSRIGEKYGLTKIKEIIFTSPSTIDAFIQIFGPLPHDKILTPIGPVTKKHLQSILDLGYVHTTTKEKN